MLSQNKRVFRYAGIGLCLAVLGGLIVYSALSGAPAMAQDSPERQMQALKAEIERPGPVSPAAIRRYDRLAAILSDCGPNGQMLKTFRAEGDPLAPQANLCINGSLDVPDPDHNRVLTTSTGTGIGNGTVGNCGLSGSGTAVNHDVYSFNLTGCAAFPTEVTMTLCGPGGCQHVGNTDTTMILYRNVSAGDPLTGNGGLPGVFNPASACTNARGGSDDIGSAAGAATNPGGATCNQTVTTQCLTPCTSPSNAGGLSGMRRQLGDGRFTLVVTGFGNGTTGGYNLYVDAPAAGCNVALAPSAANGAIAGRVTTAGGRGIGKTVVTVSGGSLSQPITALTNAFGYYTIEGLDAGTTYSVSVSAKGVIFANPTQIVTVQDDLTAVDFTSIE
jgi:hypothetical protein